jgi:hypothetical protein
LLRSLKVISASTNGTIQIFWKVCSLPKSSKKI